MIEFDDVALRVQNPDNPSDTRTILAPLSVELVERRIGVIGANGSGKSSLVRLVNGLIEPSQGKVLVNGLDVAGDGPRVRQQVGFAFTDPAAQLVMPTPLEDIELSLRRSGLSRAERADRARQILDQNGLGGHAHASVHTLSGGQKQLLSLAGVLAAQPQVLVCDEPTTLLDLRWRSHINALLDRLPQQVILVTHDLEAAARCDRVLVVDQGTVVHDGDPQESVARYRELMTQPQVLG